MVRTSYRREKEQTNDNTVRFLQPASTFAMMMVIGIVGRKLLIMAIPAQPNGPSHLLAEDGCRVRDCRSRSNGIMEVRYDDRWRPVSQCITLSYSGRMRTPSAVMSCLEYVVLGCLGVLSVESFVSIKEVLGMQPFSSAGGPKKEQR